MTTFSDYAALVETAPLEDLALRHAVGTAGFSPDLMTRSSDRPQVGVQGRILDGLDDGRLTVKEAGELLAMVHKRLREEATDGG